jgi:acyl-CoA synthetase (AMP-forming)/AMP-acid ligase II
VEGSDNIVFFGGAGVSTESGIKDFRSTDGLYHEQWQYPPETILSHTFYESKSEEFFRFYRAKLLLPGVQPNAAHRKLAEWAIEHGKRFVVMYGASEATARMGYLPPERSLEKQGSMGIPIPGGRFELIDADGQVISSAEQVGELVYYGPNVTLGYALTGADLNNPDENRGRLVTGDMAKRDADGYYTIVGRKKRFLKILGKRVNLDDVERLLKQRFVTGDIACGGRDDELWIYVTDPAIEEEAVEYVFTEMDINRKLQKSAVIPAIPRSASQKVLYSQLPPL